MSLVKGPDDEQIANMIAEHQTALLRVCFLYLRDRQLAEDAVQETFIKAMRGYPGFRGDASCKTWLTRIAVNVCRDMQRGFWFRRVDRRADLAEMNLVSPEADPRDQSLTLAVMGLPPRLREAVVLYYYQDLSVVEVAQALGISQPSVSQRLARARAKLKDALKEEPS